MDMKPGDMVQPGQTGDNRPADTQDPSVSPTSPPNDSTDLPADNDAASVTPPPAEPPVSDDQTGVPAAGAPSESAPLEAGLADAQTPPEVEQQSGDNAGESVEVQSTTPLPVAPPQGGAGVAKPSPPGGGDTPITPDVDVPAVSAPPATDPTPADELAATQSSDAGDTPESSDEPGDTSSTPPKAPDEAQPPPAANPPTDNPASNASNQPDPTNASGFSWEASEFVSHEHPAVWYVLLALITAGLMALLGLLFKEWLGAAVVGLMAVALVVYAYRQPRVLSYTIDEAGVTIGKRFLPYSSFRSFALIPIRQLLTIELDPLKRFMPNITMFVDRDEVDQVTATLQRHLPQEERPAALIDRLSHALKF